jgi:uncharacterized protein
MTILADTSGIIAFLDRSDRHHAAVVKIVQSELLSIPSTVLPEVDYLATKYLGAKAATVFLEDLTLGAFKYIAVELTDLQQAFKVMQRYEGVLLGVVDASLVALAERYKIQRILTLDRRHFSLIKPQNIDYLELLP